MLIHLAALGLILGISDFFSEDFAFDESIESTQLDSADKTLLKLIKTNLVLYSGKLVLEYNCALYIFRLVHARVG